jgi:ABC-type Fe3+ transport system substrate-binding protein
MQRTRRAVDRTRCHPGGSARCVAALVALAVVLAACGAAAPAPPASGGTRGVTPSSAPASGAKPAEWDALVAVARQEGAVSILGPPGQEYRRALVDDFQQAYPGIKVEFTSGRINDNWARLQAERAAGRYTFDVNVGGGTTATAHMKPDNATPALAPLLVLPEVTDESAWLDNHLWWVDANEPLTTLSYQGNVQLVVVYNKQLVDPAQFHSYWDLLDPKWRGKMVATDVRGGIIGGVSSRFLYKSPDLGPPFLERLYSETDLTVTADQRQLVDWLAQGQFALGLFASPNAVIVAIEQGLPLDFVPGDQWKEGSAIGPSSGAVNLFEPAPHPNAAKLFVNWLLSRDGQVAWQRELNAPSLRTDIPKDGVFPALVPKPGVHYVNGGTEEFTYPATQVIADLITQAMEKARR